MHRLVTILALTLVLAPLRVLAQGTPTPDPDLQQTRQQKRIIVQPRPAPEVLQRDADRAVDELAAQRRLEETLRDSNPSLPRRPDLTEPVSGGIQTREINKALPR
jgi:hypothetical protein